jgi:hypothetical protein
MAFTCRFEGVAAESVAPEGVGVGVVVGVAFGLVMGVGPQGVAVWRSHCGHGKIRIRNE